MHTLKQWNVSTLVFIAQGPNGLMVSYGLVQLPL